MGDPTPAGGADETGFGEGTASALGPRLSEKGYLMHGEDILAEAFDLTWLGDPIKKDKEGEWFQRVQLVGAVDLSVGDCAYTEPFPADAGMPMDCVVIVSFLDVGPEADEVDRCWAMVQWLWRPENIDTGDEESNAGVRAMFAPNELMITNCYDWINIDGIERCVLSSSFTQMLLMCVSYVSTPATPLPPAFAGRSVSSTRTPHFHLFRIVISSAVSTIRTRETRAR